MDQLIVNGSLVSTSEARVFVNDLALLRGYGVFDFFRVVEGEPLFVADYLRRFANSARLLGLELPVSLADLEGQVRRVIEANALENAGMHLLLTGGYSSDGLTPGLPNLVVQPRAVKPLAPEVFTEGAALIAHAYARDLPEAKTIHYVTAIRLLPEQRAAGAVDVLYHQGGLVSETARSNVFIVENGRLRTPGRGVLPGVTRKQVLELAQDLCEVREDDVALAELLEADEVFITSSLKGVMPVVRLGGDAVGGGRPGPITRALMVAFERRVREYLAQRPVRT